MIVDFDPKVAGVAAGIAFVLSFLIGLLSGSALGMIFVRALVFALVFFVLGAVVSVVFGKMLSNARPGEGAGAGAAPEESGGNVDFSVDGDDVFPPYAEIERESRAESVDEPFESRDYAPARNSRSAGLAQNNGFQYSSGEADAGGDVEPGGFIPGLPGIDAVSPRLGREPPASRSAALGTVEMSVGGKPKRDVQLSDFGRDADGKKIAGAIQTMLKKDEG
ncbi:MAG: hypothetical protein LBS82_05760 [Spirochaetaceae bacterium]|nr:hypothetical protein [Spirochaetaceae bacterium]